MKKLLAIALLLVVCTGCTYQIKPGEYGGKLRGSLDSHAPVSLVKNATTSVWDLFTYKSDIDEEWTSFGAEAILGLEFEGDCEDYALTVADLLISKGVDSRHLALATLNSQRKAYRKADHAVLIVSTDIGQMVVDNQMKGLVIPISEYSEYHWYSMRRMDSKYWNMIEIVRPE